VWPRDIGELAKLTEYKKASNKACKECDRFFKDDDVAYILTSHNILINHRHRLLSNFVSKVLWPEGPMKEKQTGSAMLHDTVQNTVKPGYNDIGL
jgi:hypothetical protein